MVAIAANTSTQEGIRVVAHPGYPSNRTLRVHEVLRR